MVSQPIAQKKFINRYKKSMSKKLNFLGVGLEHGPALDVQINTYLLLVTIGIILTGVYLIQRNK